MASDKLQVASDEWQVASCKWANRVIAHLRVQSSELRGEAALLLIYTAAKEKKAECGRTTFFANTAAIGERQNCGRAFRSSLRPQTQKRRNAAVPPAGCVCIMV